MRVGRFNTARTAAAYAVSILVVAPATSLGCSSEAADGGPGGSGGTSVGGGCASYTYHTCPQDTCSSEANYTCAGGSCHCVSDSSIKCYECAVQPCDPIPGLGNCFATCSRCVGMPLPGTGGGSSGCSSDGDCGILEVCQSGVCLHVDCKTDSDCSGCNRCVNNYCSYCGEGPYGCYC